MKPARMLDCGPALFGGYRVALLNGLRCEGQALFETAPDVAACAALMGLTVLTCDELVIQACTALGRVKRISGLRTRACRMFSSSTLTMLTLCAPNYRATSR